MNDDFFKISPQIFPVGEEVRFTVCGNFEQNSIAELNRLGKLQIRGIPCNGVFDDRKVVFYNYYRIYETAINPANPDELIVKMDDFSGEEGEFFCCLELVREDGTVRTLCEFEIYILEKDLLERTPLKGDIHIHSNCSECGNRKDEPQYIAAKSRENGLDFIAVTDHMQLETSESLLDFPQKFNSGFRIYRGEECHVLKEKVETRFCKNNFHSHIHIVNFGGNDCVTRYANDNYEEFFADVNARAGKIDLPYPHECKFLMAGADWICDKIHEFGGIAIFCHPAWKNRHRDNLSVPIRDYVAQNGKYDAVELVGQGSEPHTSKHRNYTEDLNIALAYYQELCLKKGKMIPVVGNTDSHNADVVLGNHCTIVFAKDNSYSSIREAILQGYSVAVVISDDIHEAPQIFGSFRLVRYAHFLFRNFYNLHDELCEIEGKLMRSVLRGEIAVESVKNVCRNNIENYTKQFFGR